MQRFHIYWHSDADVSNIVESHILWDQNKVVRNISGLTVVYASADSDIWLEGRWLKLKRSISQQRNEND